MTEELSRLRIAVLGAGKMGGILLQAFLKEKLFAPEQIVATVAHEARAQLLASQWGVEVSTNNLAAAERADLILLGVKPFQVPDLITRIQPALTRGKTVVSIAASVTTHAIEEAAAIEIPVIRAMPNTPSQVGAGMTALCRGRYATDEQVALAARIFETVGRSVTVDEKLMDAVTGLSASGPAFIYIILESLAEAGVKVGLPREVATLLAAQTTFGASQGLGYDPGGMHHRRHPGTGGGRSAGDPDQGGDAGGAAGEGTGGGLRGLCAESLPRA